MSAQYDFSTIDIPEILRFVFHPRREWTPAPSDARDYLVPVEDGVSVSCRFYAASDDAPRVLFFHGNGEVACDYDWIAPLYLRQGIALFVADYRGYGKSDGNPSFASMLHDAQVIFRFFLDTMRSRSQKAPLFIMGRSLGTLSAVSIASQHAQDLKGLIIESGTVRVAALLDLLGLPLAPEQTKGLEDAARSTLESITLPLLIIHGDSDTLIPPSEASFLFDHVGSEDKRLIAIPGAGHNDIMMIGMAQYFAAIKEFVFRFR